MSVVAVVGAQWGDEGKGRIIDLLAARAKVVIRFQGGSNAGHTVINHLGTFRLHLVPAGIFYPEVAAIIGNGVVLDPRALKVEVADLAAHGVSVANLFVSDRANVVMPYHYTLDRLEEESRGKSAIGTTGRGIGPAYVDKVARAGIRVGDLLDAATLRSKLETAVEQKNRVLTRLYGAEPIDFASLYDEFRAHGEWLAPHVTDTVALIHKAISAKQNIVLEGGQGALLDLDHGTYPFVTSSNTSAGGACAGAGIGPTQIDRALGVFKAYLTRVGAGPFPTELLDSTGDGLRERGGEYGATTGRPRRCGWFDAVLARHSVQINGLTGVAITKLDVLDAQPVIRFCTGYKLNGELVDSMPANLDRLTRCEPIYEEMPGWQCSTEGARRLEDLPSEARAYVDHLGKLIDRPIELVSVGSSREQIIFVAEVFS